MQGPQTRILADTILQALALEKNSEAQAELIGGLILAIHQFDPEWAQRTISQSLTLMETATDRSQAALLAAGLTEVRPQMTPSNQRRARPR
jgi:hypothetical protein